MTGKERREQLLDIGRRLFAERGFEGTSIEVIAQRAGVSKPVVYEHFGGKEGLYAVVVDREMQSLLTRIGDALTAGHARQLVEQAALALLTYVEDETNGFRILTRDQPVVAGSGTFSSLLNDIPSQAEARPGRWCLEVRERPREEVAAHLVNLGWNGLRGLEAKPRLSIKRPKA